MVEGYTVGSTHKNLDVLGFDVLLFGQTTSHVSKHKSSPLDVCLRGMLSKAFPDLLQRRGTFFLWQLFG